MSVEFSSRMNVAFTIDGKGVALRAARAGDSAFVYETKRAALGDYVSRTWGWEEEFQREYHRRHYWPEITSIITLDGRDIGCLVVRQEPEYILLESIYVLPEYQEEGIGTRIIRQILDYAAEHQERVRLHVLKINPAVRLYKRLDFRIIGETGHHYVMEWSNTPNSVS